MYYTAFYYPFSEHVRFDDFLIYLMEKQVSIDILPFGEAVSAREFFILRLKYKPRNEIIRVYNNFYVVPAYNENYFDDNLPLIESEEFNELYDYEKRCSDIINFNDEEFPIYLQTANTYVFIVKRYVGTKYEFLCYEQSTLDQMIKSGTRLEENGNLYISFTHVEGSVSVYVQEKYIVSMARYYSDFKIFHLVPKIINGMQYKIQDKFIYDIRICAGNTCLQSNVFNS
jgi:hypothetical protein